MSECHICSAETGNAAANKVSINPEADEHTGECSAMEGVFIGSLLPVLEMYEFLTQYESIRMYFIS